MTVVVTLIEVLDVHTSVMYVCIAGFSLENRIQHLVSLLFLLGNVLALWEYCMLLMLFMHLEASLLAEVPTPLHPEGSPAVQLEPCES